MMKKRLPNLFAALFAILLAGCATSESKTAARYDLGPLPTRSASAAPLPAISVADVLAPAWLDSQAMIYRLGYANQQHAKPYADSRWSMPPAQLFGERLKARLSQAGGVVLPAADGAVNIPVLRLEADDFTQYFSSPSHNHARIAIRASLYDTRTLRAQKVFVRDLPAPSADASGGARALAAASDEIIDDIASWLAAMPAKK